MSHNDTGGEVSLRFENGPWLLVGFVAAVAAFLAVWQGVGAPALREAVGVSVDDPWRIALVAIPGAVLFGIGWGIFRLEGIGLRDVGLSWDHARSGLLWFAGIAVALNVLLVLVTVAVGGSLEPGYADLTPLLIAVAAVVYWVFVGVGEELVARAYMQNKLVALLGGGRSRTRKALGIGVAAAVFALWHIPQRLVVAGLEPAQLPGNLLVLFGVALAFGLVYELTRNVVFTGLVHGALDFPPIAVSVFYDGGATWVQGLLLVAIVAPFLGGIWAYRRWARDHRSDDFRPQVAV